MGRRRARPIEERAELLASLLVRESSPTPLQEETVSEKPELSLAAPAGANLPVGIHKWGAKGGFDFREGDTGIGVVQTHETHLYEQQTQLTDSFGWSPIIPTDEEMSLLADLLGVDMNIVFPLLDEAGNRYVDSYFLNLARFFGDREWEKLSDQERITIARFHPVSIHTDLRLARSNTVYWEGGECLTPGDQFTANTLRTFEALSTAPGDWRVLNLSPNDTGDVSGGIIRGSLEWMAAGRDTPLVLAPGSLGTEDHGWARITTRGQFRWTAGIQEPEWKEFWFEGEALTGRWVISLFPPDPEAQWRTWVIAKPHTQTPRSAMLREKTRTVEKRVTKSLYCDILKVDNGADKRLVTGVVLQPEEVDAQGDIYSAEVIEEAAYGFMTKYRDGAGMTDMHSRRIKVSGQNADVAIVASWIAHEPTMINGTPVKQGSWLITSRVFNDTLWAKVKAGEYRGYSIGGRATVTRYNT